MRLCPISIPPMPAILPMYADAIRNNFSDLAPSSFLSHPVPVDGNDDADANERVRPIPIPSAMHGPKHPANRSVPSIVSYNTHVPVPSVSLPSTNVVVAQ